VYPIYNVPEVGMRKFHRRNIYLDEMEETEERSILQGKLDYFLTNRTHISVELSKEKKKKKR
jgi:hypothetical protein